MWYRLRVRGGIDLTVLQDIESAQGQHMGIVLHSAVIPKTMEEALQFSSSEPLVLEISFGPPNADLGFTWSDLSFS